MDIPKLIALDGHDIQSPSEQCPRQLAGPRRQVEDRSAGGETELGHERFDDGGRVLGTPALVVVGDRREMLGEGVKAHCGRVARRNRFGR